jgi:hypothetical protein
MNDLRSRVVLQADGQIRTGKFLGSNLLQHFVNSFIYSYLVLSLYSILVQ